MAASHSNPVTFDLSSRSSQLSVAVQSVRPSGKHQGLFADVAHRRFTSFLQTILYPKCCCLIVLTFAT